MIKSVLVDGDVLVFQISQSLEKVQDWGDGLMTMHVDLNEAKDTMVRKLETLRQKFNAEPVLTFSDWTQPYWRKELFPSYKSNRTKPKPMAFRRLCEFGRDELDAKIFPRLEGDDVLGILATRLYRGAVLYSIDKDMDCVPCFRSKAPGLVYEVTPQEAERNHMLQGFMGDSTDGFYGCPGVGKVKARKLLAPYIEGKEDAVWGWRKVFDTYKAEGVAFEDALTQIRLAYILTDGDYDVETGQVTLWKPPIELT